MTRSDAESRKSLRARLAILYGALYFAAGAALLAFIDVALLGTSRTTVATGTAARAGRSPHTTRGVSAHHLLLYSALVLVVIAAVAGPLGWLTAGRVLQPFRTIVTKAREISASRLQERLDLEGQYDEFTELGQTLDDLFGRLEASFETQRRFVANASHELRTPLTAERALLQVTLGDPAASVETYRAACIQLLTLSEHQARLVGALLTLATSERGVDHWEPFDLAQVVATVIGQRRHEAQQRGLRIEATLSPALTAGDPHLVEILVANLVDNALRHNVNQGLVEILVTKIAERALVSVSNTGPVIDGDEVHRLFEPFQRLGRQRTARDDGHGLGLAIVQAIARAHDADVAGFAQRDGGLRIDVTFAGPDSALAGPSASTG